MIHLVGDSIRTHVTFQDMTAVMDAFRAMFQNSCAAQARWAAHMRGSGREATRLPRWSQSRWYTWYRAFAWAADKVELLVAFAAKEAVERAGHADWYTAIQTRTTSSTAYSQLVRTYGRAASDCTRALVI